MVGHLDTYLAVQTDDWMDEMKAAYSDNLMAERRDYPKADWKACVMADSKASKMVEN